MAGHPLDGTTSGKSYRVLDDFEEAIEEASFIRVGVVAQGGEGVVASLR